MRLEEAATWGRRVAGARAAHEAELAQLIAEAKDRPCEGCHQPVSSRVLRFVHRPGTVRLFSIGDYRTALPSVEKLKEELAKCDVLCANCETERRPARRSA